jgi:large subunit ribosomal protein L6
MSRIGKLPVELPSGVTVTVSDDNTVDVKGPLNYPSLYFYASISSSTMPI